MSYRYIKGPPTYLYPTKTKKPTSIWVKRLLGPVMITLGSVILANIAWPILSYQFVLSPQLQRTKFISPISAETKSQMLSPQKPINQSNTPQVLGMDLDYTNPGTWFPNATYQTDQASEDVYFLSIPTLNIENAKVIYAGDDLDTSLIQYPGTAMPGELGSPVIFGHSILRQFYNPSENNPNRYISIFSKIMTLKLGDQIFVDQNNIRYTYEVKEKVTVEKEDVFILEQRYNNRELKLITCVPEGTYLHRGVVLAQLVEVK